MILVVFTFPLTGDSVCVFHGVSRESKFISFQDISGGRKLVPKLFLSEGKVKNCITCQDTLICDIVDG